MTGFDIQLILVILTFMSSLNIYIAQLSSARFFFIYEPHHEKTCFLHM